MGKARKQALALLCLTDPLAKALQTRALLADLDVSAIDPGGHVRHPRHAARPPRTAAPRGR